MTNINIYIVAVKTVCVDRRHCTDSACFLITPLYECELGELWDPEVHILTMPDPYDHPCTKATLQLLQMCVHNDSYQTKTYIKFKHRTIQVYEVLLWVSYNCSCT